MESQLLEGERRLVAIMFTDMVGYTLLGQKNESLSLALVEEQRKIIRPILARHYGKEVKTIGDAFLVEFPNAIDAVRCAYDIQRTTREFDLSLPPERRIHLRIGLHVGEVVESQGDISGDSVNVASRIEPLAEDGGVCLTRQVYDLVESKVDLRFTSLGDKSLKNVSVPIEVFKMTMPWVEVSSVSATQLDGRRIAIMPFVNMSTDPNDIYFADGLTEELISTISRVRSLTVISRTSIMKYKGANATTGEIGNALKVGSIIEGSVRKSANRARITAQLIDVRTDGHLWSQSYDREVGDIFAVQSEIAQKVAEALKVQLVMSEEEEVRRKPTVNAEAHTMYLKGRYFWNERTKEGVTKAVKYFEEAIKLDDRFSLAYSGLADCYTILADWFWMDPNDAFPKARNYDLKALEIEPKLAEAHASLGIIHNSYDGLWHDAESEFMQAIKQKPSLAYAHVWYSLLLNALGRHMEALEELKQAGRLDPLSRIVDNNLGCTLIMMGKPKDAIEQIKQALKEYPDFPSHHETLGWAYYLDSQFKEAVEEISQAYSLSNKDQWMKTSLSCVLALVGSRDEASKLLSELKEEAKTSYVSKVQLAEISFALGQNDEGFAYLEKAYRDRSIFTNQAGDLAALRFYPWFGAARADSRWSSLERQLGL